MGEFKKINLVTAIIYTVCLIVAIVMYWFEDDPLGWILIIEFFALGVLIPAILSAINASKKGAKPSVLLLPALFGLGSIACSYFTQNLTWFKNAPDAFEHLVNVQWGKFVLGFLGGLIGTLVGLAIFEIKKKKNQARALDT
ncbi:MAG: hypothetical protein IJ360_05185 [Clostridia bacterium]|nr:hypothetical protein [Clostridia bacterium]